MTSQKDKKKSQNNPGYPSQLTVIRLKTTPSTNDYIKSNLKKLEKDFPVMVISPVQTRGRGRENRFWLSKANLGIYLSFGILWSNPENIPFLSSGTAVSVIESLSEMAPIEAQLKWPNDIMFQNRKLGGILTENLIRGNRVTSIIGIGLNMNHRKQDFPSELSSRAISVKMISGENFSPERYVQILSKNLIKTIEDINEGHKEQIIKRANHYSRFYLGKEVQFTQDRRTKQGLFRGIHIDGGLILEDQEGTGQLIYSGEILLDQS